MVEAFWFVAGVLIGGLVVLIVALGIQLQVELKKRGR